MFSEVNISCEEKNIYVKLLLSACNAFSKIIQKVNKGEKSLGKQIEENTFFSSMTNLFHLLYMTEMVRLHGSVTEIWEGVNKCYVHLIKDQITVMKKTDTYMPILLTRLLHNNVLCI